MQVVQALRAVYVTYGSELLPVYWPVGHQPQWFTVVRAVDAVNLPAGHILHAIVRAKS